MAMTLNKEAVDFLVCAQRMSADQEKRFYDSLRTDFTEEEIKHVASLIGYFRIQLRPDMKREMVKSMGSVLYQQFNEQQPA